jgi:drug/metabolite transporter (DMT)-like permease
VRAFNGITYNARMREQPGEENAVGAVYIALTLLAWSSVPLFLKYFTVYIDAWTTNGWRYGMSALFWLPLLIVGWGRGVLPSKLWRAAVVPSAVNLVGQCCFAWAPYFINPGLLTFMLRLQIIFVALGAFALFPSERRVLRSPTYWLAVLAVFAGAAGTSLLGAEPPRGATAFGIFLAIIAGLFFAAYSLSVRYFMHDVRPVTAFAVISNYTAAGLVIIMVTVGRQHGLAVMSFTSPQWCMLVGSAFIGIAFSHVLYYAAMARLGVVVSAGVILLQPFIASAASYFLFAERLTMAQWICGMAAVGGAIFMLRSRQRLNR